VVSIRSWFKDTTDRGDSFLSFLDPVLGGSLMVAVVLMIAGSTVVCFVTGLAIRGYESLLPEEGE
jgi:hypothetical protein